MPPDLGRVTITGSTGFVGRAVAGLVPGCVAVRLGLPDWRERLEATEFEGALVFHLAARVHRPGDDDAAAYLHDNAEKTRVLAQTSAARGARRLVFLSTIKVNAEETAERPVRAGDSPNPADAYARSKWAAEQVLAEAARKTGIEVAVIRAPLVFGAGARGHLLSLLRLVDTPWPLPFGAIENRRTLVHVDDLAELLVRCATSPDAPGRTFLAGDPAAVSTSRLITMMRRAFGRPPRLVAMPPALLEKTAAALGRGALMRRLTRSLEVDVSETMRALQWAPRIDLEGGIAAMARDYRAASAPR